MAAPTWDDLRSKVKSAVLVKGHRLSKLFKTLTWHGSKNVEHISITAMCLDCHRRVLAKSHPDKDEKRVTGDAVSELCDKRRTTKPCKPCKKGKHNKCESLRCRCNVEHHGRYDLGGS